MLAGAVLRRLSQSWADANRATGMAGARRLSGALLLVFVLADARSAIAQDASLSLTYRAIFHAYQVRLYTDLDADGNHIDKFRNVDPLYMTLDVGGWSLGPSASMDVVSSLRFRTDFGTGFNRDTPNDVLDPPKVEGTTDFAFLMLYFDWRNVVEDFDLRIGRQLIVDDLDWYSLDGVKGTLRLANSSTAAVSFELYIGSPVRLDFLFPSESFINDGYEISDGAGIAFGGSANARLFGDLQLHASYRQELTFRKNDIAVFRPTATTTAQTAETAAIQGVSAGTIGLQESLIGAGLGYTLRAVDLDLFGSMVWNLIFGKLDLLRVGAGWNPRPDLHVGVEYLQVYPRFAADSIFNIFNIFPYAQPRAEVDLEIIRGLHVGLGYFALLYQGGPHIAATYQGPEISHGPSGSLSYRFGDFAAGIDAEIATNTGGSYAFGGNYRRFELFGDGSFLENRIGATLRLGALTIQNDWFGAIDSGQVQDPETMFSIELGGRARILEWLFARVNLVKNFSSYLEGDFRVLSVLEVHY